MGRVHKVVYGLGPHGWSMDWVHMVGPWSRSTGVVCGPGSMFCIHALKVKPLNQDHILKTEDKSQGQRE